MTFLISSLLSLETAHLTPGETFAVEECFCSTAMFHIHTWELSTTVNVVLLTIEQHHSVESTLSINAESEADLHPHLQILRRL